MNSTKTIGIIGGGQLGQMMAIAAIYRGHKVITLDPAANCPAARVSEVIVAPYDDVAALRQLAERCDVLTYEFENMRVNQGATDNNVLQYVEKYTKKNSLLTSNT